MKVAILMCLTFVGCVAPTSSTPALHDVPDADAASEVETDATQADAAPAPEAGPESGPDSAPEAEPTEDAPAVDVCAPADPVTACATGCGVVDLGCGHTVDCGWSVERCCTPSQEWATWCPTMYPSTPRAVECANSWPSGCAVMQRTGPDSAPTYAACCPVDVDGGTTGADAGTD